MRCCSTSQTWCFRPLPLSPTHIYTHTHTPLSSSFFSTFGTIPIPPTPPLFSFIYIFISNDHHMCFFFFPSLSLFTTASHFFLFVVVMCAHTKGRKKDRKKERQKKFANDNFRVIGRRPYWTHPAEAKSHPASVKFGCYRILYRHSSNSSDYSGGVNLVAIFTIIIFFFSFSFWLSKRTTIIEVPWEFHHQHPSHTHTHTQFES